jgi:hypothetical protein
VARFWCWRCVGRREFHLGDYAACEDGGVVGPLSIHGYGGVCLQVHPSGLVSREGVDVAPKDSIGCTWGARASVEAVVDYVAFSWWRRRWPLIFRRGGTGMAVDVVGNFTLPLCWGGFSG